jgi:hypothetical protein
MMTETESDMVAATLSEAGQLSSFCRDAASVV